MPLYIQQTGQVLHTPRLGSVPVDVLDYCNLQEPEVVLPEVEIQRLIRNIVLACTANHLDEQTLNLSICVHIPVKHIHEYVK